MLLLREIGEFCLAVLKHWQAYMTGGIVIALLTGYGWLTGKALSHRKAVVGIVAFLLVAFFMSWRDQLLVATDMHRQLEKLTLPQLQGAIDTISAGQSKRPGDTFLLITAHITNLGAPSIAEFSECKIKTASGKSGIGEYGPIPLALGVPYKTPKLTNGRAALVFPREDNLLVKATANPVQTGGASTGWLYFIVHGMDANQILSPGTVATLVVKDVRGQALTLSYSVTTENMHDGLPQDTPF